MIRVLPFARAKLAQFDCYDVDLNFGSGYVAINKMTARFNGTPGTLIATQRRRKRQTRAFCEHAGFEPIPMFNG